MSLETQVEILNNQLRQLMLIIPAAVKMLSGGKAVLDNVGGETDLDKIYDLVTKKDSGNTGAVMSDDMGIDSLPDGNIDWNDIDAMDCPYHSGMMAGTRGKNATGATKGCFAKIKGKEYTQEMYLADRRILIELRANKSDAGELLPEADNTEKTGAPIVSNNAPVSSGAPQVNLSPTPALLPVDEPGIGFHELCTRHIAKHGEEQVAHRLTQCGIPGHSTQLIQDSPDEDMHKVVVWVSKELLAHDETASS